MLVMVIITVVVPLQEAVKSLRYLKKTRSLSFIFKKRLFSDMDIIVAFPPGRKIVIFTLFNM